MGIPLASHGTFFLTPLLCWTSPCPDIAQFLFCLFHFPSLPHTWCGLRLPYKGSPAPSLSLSLPERNVHLPRT